MATTADQRLGAAAPARAPFSAWYVLAALSVISLVSFADRYVLLLLSEPIRKHFSLDDVRVGLLQGTSAALFGAVASYPLGWLVGRFDNRLVLAACIAVWSAAVALSGLAQTFPQLLLFSGLVAAGEACLAPVAYSLIPRLFVGAQRQAANSIFAATAIGGGALAIALAGLLVEQTRAVQALSPALLGSLAPWRFSFILAASAGPLIVIAALTLPIGARAAPAGPPAGADAPDAHDFWRYFRRHSRILLALSIGSGLAGLAFGAIGPWIAIAASRLFAASPASVGAGMGTAQIASAGSAFLLSLVLARFVVPRLGQRGPAIILALTAVGMLACTVFLPLISSVGGLYLFFAIFGIFLSLGAMFQPTIYQALLPTPLIGRMVAVQFIITMICASTAGPLVGEASDLLGGDGKHLITAMTLVAAPLLVLAFACLAMVSGPGFAAAIAEAEAANAASPPR